MPVILVPSDTGLLKFHWAMTVGATARTVRNTSVLVTPPLSSGNNLSYWYVDWNPKPPDMNAGICNKVLFDNSGPVVLRDPYVKTVLPLPATNSADLTVYVDAVNGSSSSVTGSLSGIITKAGYSSITFTQNVILNPGERREISFAPDTFTQLHVINPSLWWPIPLGRPARTALFRHRGPCRLNRELRVQAC